MKQTTITYKYFTALLLVFFSTGIYTQTNILIPDVRIKAVDAQSGIDFFLNNVIYEVFSQSDDIVYVTDRKHLKEIEYIRKRFLKESNVQSSVLQGAKYSINSTFSNYRENLRSNVFKDTLEKKTTTHYTMSIAFDLEMKMVDIESGEVVLKYKISPNGWAYQKNNNDKEIIRKLLLKDAFIDMSYCLKNILYYNFYYFINPELDVIFLNKIEKGAAKNLIAQGSFNNRKVIANQFNVFKKTITQIGNEKITRKTHIGEVKLDEGYPNYTGFIVKKGGKDILQAFNNGEELVLQLEKPEVYDQCISFLTPSSRVSSKKKYESEKPKPQKKKTTSGNNKSTKKKTPRKKIERKVK